MEHPPCSRPLHLISDFEDLLTPWANNVLDDLMPLPNDPSIKKFEKFEAMGRFLRDSAVTSEVWRDSVDCECHKHIVGFKVPMDAMSGLHVHKVRREDPRAAILVGLGAQELQEQPRQLGPSSQPSQAAIRQAKTAWHEP